MNMTANRSSDRTSNFGSCEIHVVTFKTMTSMVPSIRRSSSIVAVCPPWLETKSKSDWAKLSLKLIRRDQITTNLKVSVIVAKYVR